MPERPTVGCDGKPTAIIFAIGIFLFAGAYLFLM
jgi:hypothetical protein